VFAIMFWAGMGTGVAQDRPQAPLRPRGASEHTIREAQPRDGKPRYSIEQATSDQAQLHTIAFSGLAFLTGDFGCSTFLPPGKVADFFGFQYMRDIDAAGKGHNPMFLDRIAGNVLRILSEEQRRVFEEAARDQEPLLRDIALKRFPLVATFHRDLAGERPAGSGGPDPKAVADHCAELFSSDARLAYRRAKAFGQVSAGLAPSQRESLARLRFGDFNSWPDLDPEAVRRMRPRGASKLVSVGYMTLASEFFSWYAGSVEADVYFCPERHGTYFGGFYMKDMPAMGQRDYDIPTSLTGDAGAAFIELLTANQRYRLRQVIERQRKPLQEIVAVRRSVSLRLRAFLEGSAPSESDIVALGAQYGRLDGMVAYEYATAFVSIHATIDESQRERLSRLRPFQGREKGSAFLYSDRIPMPVGLDADYLFGL
jgi:hypothetical protein